MPNVVIVGTQWGDEGKGKVVDVLSPLMACVVRFQGGNNAGHTLVVEGENRLYFHWWIDPPLKVGVYRKRT